MMLNWYIEADVKLNLTLGVAWMLVVLNQYSNKLWYLSPEIQSKPLNSHWEQIFFKQQNDLLFFIF